MVFKPVNDDHSIQTVAFTAPLTAPLQAATVDALRAQPADWKSALPALDLVQSIELFPSNNPLAPARPTIRVGLDDSIKRPDGASVWALRFHGNTVAVECSRYTRWNLIWSEARTYLRSALKRIAEIDNSIAIASIGLWYIDAFVSSDTQADTRDLFANSKYFAQFAYEQGAEWHVHTGWFERRSFGRILHNLNVDTQIVPRSNPVSGESFSEAVSTVTHSQVCTRFTSLNLTEMNPVEFDREFEHMHDRNKQILAELLCEGVKSKI